ncbi:hypothetical protein E2C01_067166 [Portunus trituberculatus]|uniref:Uncharacterized protein n=1 Tax=Portunus trituberculatus TaxID=210409 RepID=A0A5B7HNE4_PORTR|nr:hypothetical protein [Portunus trituberculatus]
MEGALKVEMSACVKVEVRCLRLEILAPSEEAQPTLGPWIGFEPLRLETPRTPKHAWFLHHDGPQS